MPTNGQYQNPESWSPDGRTLLFTQRSQAAGADIYVLLDWTETASPGRWCRRSLMKDRRSSPPTGSGWRIARTSQAKRRCT